MQGNKVKSSNHIEMEGLKNALHFLTEKSINVNTLVTDWHKQIIKLISQRYPEIDHCFDV